MFTHGQLVTNQTQEFFEGIGKVISIDEVNSSAVVAFFKSPLRPEVDNVEVPFNSIQNSYLFDEHTVFCFSKETNKWRRARYGGERPNHQHLVIYRSDDTDVLDISDIYVLNLGNEEVMKPDEFLKARYSDTPHFDEWRNDFIASYINQRSACRSISSIPSSSIELEPHQIAVVRRVLQDQKKKYLLADEVGLGKTIEAGIIIREQLLTEERGSIAVISVPESIVQQWKDELVNRFYLSELIDESLFICTHDQLPKVVELEQPGILVIDEAHQIASWAWSENKNQSEKYKKIAEAAEESNTCLIISGTPLVGNELNLLSMLHLLAPDQYSLDEEGIINFKEKVVEREKIGAIYLSLNQSTDNGTIEDNLDKCLEMLSDDEHLIYLVEELRPYVDLFAEEDSPDRDEKIKKLRIYLGENYRLHQRILRNRRIDPDVEMLFPGLSGATLSQWKINPTSLSVDQYLDSFKSEFIDTGTTTLAITKSNFKEWLEIYFTDPYCIVEKVNSVLNDSQSELKEFEIDALQLLKEYAEEECISKNYSLVTCVKKYLLENHNIKIVIFCGREDIADSVTSHLKDNVDFEIERHVKGKDLKFVKDENVKVLICGPSGEDGLNLHGGEKIVIHHSLPLMFDRIEQRLGRVNRYSAHIKAKPILSQILVPESQSYYVYWLQILNDAVKIFNQSVASLQYILENEFENVWSKVPNEGISALDDLRNKLSGENGLVEKELTNILHHEVLLGDDIDIVSSKDFSKNIAIVDAEAETNASMMFHWIVKSLQFVRIQEDRPDIFKFLYQLGAQGGKRTLMDVNTLVSECLTGLVTGEGEPITANMCADRHIVSHGHQVYPFRYGQPFIDVIYNLMKSDVRGICSAKFRMLNMKLSEPKAYFKISWLLTFYPESIDKTKQRKGDEKFKPRIITQWINQTGKVTTDENILKILNAPYKKEEEGSYHDVNIRPEYWQHINDDFPEENWIELVKKIVSVSKNAFASESENSEINEQILSMSVTFLIGGKS